MLVRDFMFSSFEFRFASPRCVRRAGLAALLVGCVFAAGGACTREIHGTFAWSSNDDRGIEQPERGLLLETEFRIGRDNLYFFEYETVWWVYQIQGGAYNKDGFLAALYENNLTPDPVEVDLRRVPIQRDGCCDYIRQYYEDLAPGRYLLKIAYESRVVDQVEFYVVPPGGPAGIEPENEAVDFASEGIPAEDEIVPGSSPMDPSNGYDDPGESDEILRYSSG